MRTKIAAVVPDRQLRPTLVLDYKRPSRGVCDQTPPHWVLANVFRLEFPAFVPSDATIEIISLPLYTKLSGRVAFPVSNDFGHLFFLGEGQQGVKMVGHEEEQTGEPALLRMVAAHSVEQRLATSGDAKLILTASFATDGDEEQTAGLNPGGWNVA